MHFICVIEEQKRLCWKKSQGFNFRGCVMTVENREKLFKRLQFSYNEIKAFI